MLNKDVQDYFTLYRCDLFLLFVVHSGQFKMNLLPSPPLSPFLHYTLSRAILLSIPFKNLRLLQYRAVIHLGYWTIYPLQFCKTFTFSLIKANSMNMQISTFC